MKESVFASTVIVEIRQHIGRDAEDVMTKQPISVTADTSINQVVKIMEEKRLLTLPVIVKGKVAYSITRHDLLRAWIGLGMDIETNMA